MTSIDGDSSFEEVNHSDDSDAPPSPASPPLAAIMTGQEHDPLSSPSDGTHADDEAPNATPSQPPSSAPSSDGDPSLAVADAPAAGPPSLTVETTPLPVSSNSGVISALSPTSLLKEALSPRPDAVGSPRSAGQVTIWSINAMDDDDETGNAGEESDDSLKALATGDIEGTPDDASPSSLEGSNDTSPAVGSHADADSASAAAAAPATTGSRGGASATGGSSRPTRPAGGPSGSPKRSADGRGTASSGAGSVSTSRESIARLPSNSHSFVNLASLAAQQPQHHFPHAHQTVQFQQAHQHTFHQTANSHLAPLAPLQNAHRSMSHSSALSGLASPIPSASGLSLGTGVGPAGPLNAQGTSRALAMEPDARAPPAADVAAPTRSLAPSPAGMRGPMNPDTGATTGGTHNSGNPNPHTKTPLSQLNLAKVTKLFGESTPGGGPHRSLSRRMATESTSWAIGDVDEDNVQLKFDQMFLDDILRTIQTESRSGLHFLDFSTLMREGCSSLINDSFTRCFVPQKARRWNWNIYLFIMYCLGVVLRYVVLFPLRVLTLISAFVLFFLLRGITGLIFQNSPRRRIQWQRRSLQTLSYIFSMALSAVIKYHGTPPTRRPNQVYVANHTSLIDVVVLNVDQIYSMLGQRHVGFVGWLQDSVLAGTDCLWFNRMEAKDRKMVSEKIREHTHDINRSPLLIFPEGTCVNNKHIVMFKRGAFELDADVCPIAIKYNKDFADAFWNSKKESFLGYLFKLMTSWALVVDVYYLEPQTRHPEESVTMFADRVKKLIARCAGLVPVPWDGYLKYYRPRASFMQYRQNAVSKLLRLRLDLHENLNIEEPPSDGNILDFQTDSGELEALGDEHNSGSLGPSDEADQSTSETARSSDAQTFATTAAPRKTPS